MQESVPHGVDGVTFSNGGFLSIAMAWFKKRSEKLLVENSSKGSNEQ